MQIGGNTACLEVRADDRLVILDGGTGLRALGDELIKNMPTKAAMFFSHVHWDHIQGFPFFKPAFVPGNEFDLYGGRNLTGTLSETLAGQMNFPNFPVTLEQMASVMRFHQFDAGEVVDLGGGLTVEARELNHPNGCYGYRISYEGKSFAFCTDTEHLDEPDQNVLDLARDAEIFVYDAQYTPEEYTGEEGGMPKTGWGHSTFVVGAELAEMAGAKRLVLYHHDPAQDDAAVLEKERRCRELFPATDAAREGLVYDL
jgi:phosphoribosyl 1,2-cyclic phosphodiesterase